MTKHVTARWESGGGTYTITHRVDRLSNGDALTVKETETRKVERQYPPEETEEAETTYSVRSSVLGGAVLTELYGDGTKKATRIYTGNDALAEQRRTEDGQTSSVVWKHKDLMTGGFDSIKADGGRYRADEAEFKAEFEPLGAVIPETDPYFAPGTEPMPKAFHASGGGFAADPENECLWDNVPIRCDLINMVTRSSSEAHWEVNTRTPGGYQLQSILQGSLWRYDLYCEGDCGEYIDGGTNAPSGLEDPDVIKVDTNRVFIDSFYIIHGTDLLTNFVGIRSNIEKFNETAQAVRNLLSEDGGDNPCAQFFGGAGIEALDNIVALVNDNSFRNMNDQGLGIRMSAAFTGLRGQNVTTQSLVSTDFSGATSIINHYSAISPSSIWINTGGPFFTKFGRTNIGSYPRGTLKSRVLQLLHEIGHLVIIDSKQMFTAAAVGNGKLIIRTNFAAFIPLLDIDGNDEDLSKENTAKVEEACASQIDAIQD